jgi:biopolymer transport protein TolR
MSMSTGGGDKKGVQSEINVTPLIDVLLVLLIIFLVVMPIMMKMETLDIPRKLENDEVIADQNAVMITLTVHSGGGDITYDENWKSSGEKVVFVHFDPDVQWGEVVQTMDSIRSLATDANHDEIKVALKIKDDEKDAAKQ